MADSNSNRNARFGIRFERKRPIRRSLVKSELNRKCCISEWNSEQFVHIRMIPSITRKSPEGTKCKIQKCHLNIFHFFELKEWGWTILVGWAMTIANFLCGLTVCWPLCRQLFTVPLHGRHQTTFSIGCIDCVHCNISCASQAKSTWLESNGCGLH